MQFLRDTKSLPPKVLVLALGRINSADHFNNGLLLRNLFNNFPKENIAQIYSSGDNGDEGFFKSYYCLSKEDRRFGHFFYKVKNEVHSEKIPHEQHIENGIKRKIKTLITNLLINTGIYEIIFKVRISKEMESWIYDFKPDIILAQGYNLSFALLPILIKKKFNCKLAFFTTDDWPGYLYNGMLGENKLLSFWARSKAIHLSKELIKLSDINIAFGHPMAQEYEKRYNKQFTVISHSDDPKRFELSHPQRLSPKDVFSILAIGNFNCFRWPLLLDLNEACTKLNDEGIKVEISILSSNIEFEGLQKFNEAKYINVYPDPGNDDLPSFLKGADLLFLAEGFDENFVNAIRLSISSKAHLFMFSQKPIIIYAHENTGIAKYAIEEGWAKVITERSNLKLVEAIKQIINNNEGAMNDALNAYNFALKKHDNTVLSQLFQQLISSK